MIKRLKWRFVITIMSFVTAILLAVFLSVLISTKNGMERASEEALQRALTQPDFQRKPGAAPGGGDGNRGFGNQFPYFTVTVPDDGEPEISAGGSFLLGEDFDGTGENASEALSELIDTVLGNGSDMDVIRSYSLRFLRQRTDTGWIIAFCDISLETSAMSILILNSLIIGVAALTLVFFLAILMASRAVHPIQQAWDKQRRFVADASHELKTPLTVILASSDMLAASPDADAGSRSRWTDNIKAEAVRMRILVEELLSLARSDSEHARKEYCEVDLSDLAANTALSFEPAVYESGRTLETDISDALRVRGDPARLRQLFGVLLDNALKYSDESACIRLRLTSGAKHTVLISVYNPGEPIPQEDYERIFERFYRRDEARTGGGYGLGLSIASNIVSAHGGRIWVESGGGGNTFFVSLPLA